MDDDWELLRTFTGGGLAFLTGFKGRFGGWSTGRTDSDISPPLKVGEIDDGL
jgi:hypothetical protein